MKCEEIFQETYRKDPDDVAFCPYRICPIGAHVDHQLGRITGLAIDRGIYFAYSPKQNGVIELASLQFDKRAQFHIREIADVKQNDWADYLDRILTMTGEQLLQDAGIVSHAEAMEHATNEYRKYKQRTLSDVEQDYLDSIKRLGNMGKKDNSKEADA